MLQHNDSGCHGFGVLDETVPTRHSTIILAFHPLPNPRIPVKN